jgi:hypothetical protein
MTILAVYVIKKANRPSAKRVYLLWFLHVLEWECFMSDEKTNIKNLTQNITCTKSPIKTGRQVFADL